MTASPTPSLSSAGLVTDISGPGATRTADPESRARFARTDEGGAAAFAEERRRLRETHVKEPRPAGIGWKIGLAIDLALLSLPIPAVIVIPPLLECRHKAVHVGFFAGDSFETCAKRRVVARWNHLDSRIKMIVRKSGQ